MLRKTFFVFSLILFSAYPIAADPFVITSGSATFIQQNGLTRTVLNFSGQGLSVFAVGDAVFGPSPCRFCLPGNTTSLSYDPFLSPTDFLFGGVTINGASYTITAQGYPFPPPSPLVHAQFSGPFVAGSATIPFSDAATVTLTAPFTLNGGMSWRDAGGVMFGMTLTGSGYATLALSRDQFGGYSFNSLTYNFVPVPEPATIFLLASGLGLLASRLTLNRKF